MDGAGVPDCQEPLTDATPTARDAALLARGATTPPHRSEAEGSGGGEEDVLSIPAGGAVRDLVAVVPSAPGRPVFGQGCPRPVPWDKAVAGPPGGRTKDETPDSPIREKR